MRPGRASWRNLSNATIFSATSLKSLVAVSWSLVQTEILSTSPFNPFHFNSISFTSIPQHSWIVTSPAAKIVIGPSLSSLSLSAEEVLVVCCVLLRGFYPPQPSLLRRRIHGG